MYYQRIFKYKSLQREKRILIQVFDYLLDSLNKENKDVPKLLFF